MTRAVSDGARVIGIDLSAAGNQEITKLCPSRSFVYLTASVSAEQTWRDVLQQSQEAFSAIPDTVVNCAGFVHLGQDPHTVSEEDFDKVWQVNVKPLYLGVKVIVQHWIEKGIHGHVINIGSVSSQRPRPTTLWYAASKGAIDTVRTPPNAGTDTGTDITSF